MTGISLKLLKGKSFKDLDDFDPFMREVSKDVVEAPLKEEQADHLGFEKYDQKAKVIDNSRYGKCHNRQGRGQGQRMAEPVA